MWDFNTIKKEFLQRCIRLNRYWYRLRYGFSEFNPMQEDWDNLLIIDAARPDYTEEYITGQMNNSDFNCVEMPASYSGGFIQKVFNKKEYHDAVYVTANPHTGTTLNHESFHAVWNLLDSHWDKELETVPPESVVEKAKEAHERYPDKRLVVHFMQPHYPFLGPTGKDIAAGIGTELGGADSPHPWNEQMWGNKIPRHKLLKAYEENHKIALESVDKLVGCLTGKTVITADHTNLIGERGFPIPMRMYGHIIDFPHPNLTRVPWIEVPGERRDTVSEPPRDIEELDSETVEHRLEALGYK
jgi:hypothetical protein